MSNLRTPSYISCQGEAMADPVQCSSSGYCSGSDSDTDAPQQIVTEEKQKVDSDSADDIVKQQSMYIYNKQYQKWHECDLILRPPHLQVKEYEDTHLEIQERQLEHIHQRWFHGDISRREAKYILQDYNGGEGSFLVRTSESYSGKFAISFVHEERVKHVVIETKPDPATGVLYYITPKGPCFDSLSALIEKAKASRIIQNHAFDVILTKSPPKPDQRWLHTNIKTLSQAEHLMRKDAYSAEGSFITYPTTSPFAPYSLVYRSEGSITHTTIMTSQRSSHGFSLNGVTAPVLYKLIHYFMENPIHGDTVLQPASQDKDGSMSNSAIALEDFYGDCSKSELCFHNGDLITNISRRSGEWCVGDHRGDRQKFFPTSSVRFLSKDELHYIKDVRDFYQKSRTKDSVYESDTDSHTLNLRTDYSVTFETDGSSPVINIEPINPLLIGFRTFTLSCASCHDVEKWYQALEKTDCISRNTVSTVRAATDSSVIATRRKSNTRRKRGSCIIS